MSQLACQQATPQALYHRAGQAVDAGDTARAIKLYEELLQQAPESVDARIILGVLLAQALSINSGKPSGNPVCAAKKRAHWKYSYRVLGFSGNVTLSTTAWSTFGSSCLGSYTRSREQQCRC